MCGSAVQVALCAHAAEKEHLLAQSVEFAQFNMFLKQPFESSEKWRWLLFSMPHNIFLCPCSIYWICLLEESPLGASAQYLFEGLSEVFVEDGVYDRVE